MVRQKKTFQSANQAYFRPVFGPCWAYLWPNNSLSYTLHENIFDTKTLCWTMVFESMGKKLAWLFLALAFFLFERPSRSKLPNNPKNRKITSWERKTKQNKQGQLWVFFSHCHEEQPCLEDHHVAKCRSQNISSVDGTSPYMLRVFVKPKTTWAATSRIFLIETHVYKPCVIPRTSAARPTAVPGTGFYARCDCKKNGMSKWDNSKKGLHRLIYSRYEHLELIAFGTWERQIGMSRLY